MSVNLLVLSGRLGKRPDLKSTTSGKSVSTVSIAVDDGYGERKKTIWWNIECWDKNAEAVVRFGDKGYRITVTGRLSTDEYEKDGIKVVRAKIIANQVDFIDFPPKNEDSKNEDSDDIPF